MNFKLWFVGLGIGSILNFWAAAQEDNCVWPVSIVVGCWLAYLSFDAYQNITK